MRNHRQSRHSIKLRKHTIELSSDSITFQTLCAQDSDSDSDYDIRQKRVNKRARSVLDYNYNDNLRHSILSKLKSLLKLNCWQTLPISDEIHLKMLKETTLWTIPDSTGDSFRIELTVFSREIIQRESGQGICGVLREDSLSINRCQQRGECSSL